MCSKTALSYIKRGIFVVMIIYSCISSLGGPFMPRRKVADEMGGKFEARQEAVDVLRKSTEYVLPSGRTFSEHTFQRAPCFFSFHLLRGVSSAPIFDRVCKFAGTSPDEHARLQCFFYSFFTCRNQALLMTKFSESACVILRFCFVLAICLQKFPLKEK